MIRTLRDKFPTGTFATFCSTVAAIAVPVTAQAGSLTPERFEATIGVGETVTVNKTVTTDETGGIVDFYFLADNTGSMGGVINNVRSVASDLLPALSGIYDAQFGVGRYFGDPSEFGSNPTRFDIAYDVLQPITSNTTDVTTAFGEWIASGGGDGPEANLYGLQQAATNGADTTGLGTNPVGGSSGEATGWRTGSRKVVLWFGDVVGHQDTVTLASALDVLDDENVIVVGFNSSSEGFGIDGDFADATSPPDNRNQASTITDATDGALVNSFASVPITDLVDTIVDAVGTATSTIDLELITMGDTSGLDISFTCLSAEGCEDVPGGESRMFEMSITGLTSGVYDFETIAVGVSDAVERDTITVGDGGGNGPRVPEPTSVLALLLAGSLGASAIRKRSA